VYPAWATRICLSSRHDAGPSDDGRPADPDLPRHAR
jgi:hypothetical protein